MARGRCLVGCGRGGDTQAARIVMMKVVLAPEAKADVAREVEWHRERSVRAAENFLLAVSVAGARPQLSRNQLPKPWWTPTPELGGPCSVSFLIEFYTSSMRGRPWLSQWCINAVMILFGASGWYINRPLTPAGTTILCCTAQARSPDYSDPIVTCAAGVLGKTAGAYVSFVSTPWVARCCLVWLGCDRLSQIRSDCCGE